MYTETILAFEAETLQAELDKYLTESPLGRVLKKVLTSEDIERDFNERYLRDYIRMSYKPVSQQQAAVDKEYEVIVYDVKVGDLHNKKNILIPADYKDLFLYYFGLLLCDFTFAILFYLFKAIY